MKTIKIAGCLAVFALLATLSSCRRSNQASTQQEKSATVATPSQVAPADHKNLAVSFVAVKTFQSSRLFRSQAINSQPAAFQNSLLRAVQGSSYG
jgi:hypothetical protein